MKINNIYFSLYKAFILSSMATLLIGAVTQGSVSLGAMLTAYSILIIALLMILVIFIQNVLEHNVNESILKKILSMISSGGPFLLMLGIIGLLMYLTINYQSIITNNHVSISYFNFSNITNAIILLQLYLLYTELNTQNFIDTGKVGKVTMSILYLLAVITGISSLTQFTILKYFTTDGFKI